MKILKREEFNQELKNILYFIAQDNKQNAKIFKNELIERIHKLSNMPYKFRKSIFFNDEQIRDLVFKGYVIAYEINEIESEIIIIGICKYKINIS